MVDLLLVSLTVLHRHESRRFDVRCVPPVPVELAALMANHKQPNAQRTHGAAQMPRIGPMAEHEYVDKTASPTELPMLNPLLRLYQKRTEADRADIRRLGRQPSRLDHARISRDCSPSLWHLGLEQAPRYAGTVLLRVLPDALPLHSQHLRH